MPDETYSIKEVLDDRFNEMAEHLKEIKFDGKKTMDAVAIQNGRVGKLEAWSIEAQKVIENTTKVAATTSEEYRVDRARLWTAIAIVVLLGSTIITLAIMAIKSEIKNTVTTAIQTNNNKYFEPLDN